MIITEALDFVESEEMRAFLTSRELPSINDYVHLICESPLPIADKVKALDKLIQREGREPLPNARPWTLIENAKKAMKELAHPTEGSIFSLTYVEREKDGNNWPIATPVAFYTSFKGVTMELRRRRSSYLGQLNGTIENEGMGAYKWAHVAQFAPVTPAQIEAGQARLIKRAYVKDVMTKRMDMILDSKANVIYLDVDLKYMDYQPYDPYYAGVYEPEIPELHGRKRKLNLPTPFQPGEIITMDMRPFFPVRHAVMLDEDQRFNFVGAWCAYVGEDDRVYAGNVNQMQFRYPTPESRAYESRDYYSKPYKAEFNPLLRATRFSGELPKHEWMLQWIADGIQSNPGLATEIQALFDGPTFVGHPHNCMEKDAFRQKFAALFPLEVERYSRETEW